MPSEVRNSDLKQVGNFELLPAELARRFGICPTDARHRGDNSGALRSRSAGGLSSGFCAVGRRRRRCKVRGIVAIVVSILVAACEPPLPTGAVTRAPEPKPHYGLGISRDAFTSIIEKDDLPLPLEVWSRHDDPATSDALMARFHPEPGETPVSLGLWGKSDNLRAVDVECYTPIRKSRSKFEQELCGVLMALVLKLTVPEWTQRNDWLLATMAGGHRREDMIRKVADARRQRQVRFSAASYAVGLEVAAVPSDGDHLSQSPDTWARISKSN